MLLPGAHQRRKFPRLGFGIRLRLLRFRTARRATCRAWSAQPKTIFANCRQVTGLSILGFYSRRFIGIWLCVRNWLFRFPCRDDPVGLGSPQLQIFQEFPWTADELYVVAGRKPERDSDFLYERHAITRIKTVRGLRIFPPTLREGKHGAILLVADRERKVRFAQRDVVVWHRDDITFYRLPKDGRRDCLSRETEIGLDGFGIRCGLSAQRDIGVGKCDAHSIGAKMMRIERQRDLGTCT